jgi:hypothetical protein
MDAIVAGQVLEVAAAAVNGLLLVRTPPGPHRFTMTDDKDKGKSRSAGDARQDRLKLALRENLKRRKSQARGRSDANATPRDEAGASLHDELGKKPGE